MENARPVVVSIDAAAPAVHSFAERGKKAAGRTKRCEHKRKRSENGEQRAEPEPRNAPLTQSKSSSKRGSKRACANTATAPAINTSTKKRPVQKRKPNGAATEQRLLSSRKERRGHGDGVRRHSSQYQGVCWDKSNNKWAAAIKHDGKRQYLGCFEDEKDAGSAYDKAARVQHGVNARS
jgi:hypothetical protein